MKLNSRLYSSACNLELMENLVLKPFHIKKLF